MGLFQIGLSETRPRLPRLHVPSWMNIANWFDQVHRSYPAKLEWRVTG
jgi:hypothetical protein